MSQRRADGATELLPLPASGRTFSTSRRVRLSDTTPSGALRLDALARYVQDVASDDAREALPDEYLAWVVRRTVFVVHQPPTSEERVELTTWCSGYGGRWAERRTSVRGSAGGHCESVVVWVAIHAETGSPVRLPDTFHERYDEAAAGRRVTARLQHGDPTPGAEQSDWRFRAADLDRLGHVNNAAYWVVAEEQLGERTVRPSRAEIEYRRPIAPSETLRLHREGDQAAPTRDLWLAGADDVAASIRLHV